MITSYAWQHGRRSREENLHGFQDPRNKIAKKRLMRLLWLIVTALGTDALKKRKEINNGSFWHLFETLSCLLGEFWGKFIAFLLAKWIF